MSNGETASGIPARFRRALASMGRAWRGDAARGMNFSGRHDLDGRWALIAPRLPPAPRWYLDIGTNNGDTLRRLAARGDFAVGIEVARESAPATVPDRAALMIAQVDSATLDAAPAFEGVFLLSVFHRIWAIQGPDQAREVLRAAVRRCRILFFEGSSRHGRWTDLGQAAPEFEDMSEAGSVDWHRRLLGGSQDGVTVEFLGITHSLKTREPRPLFVLTR